MSEPRTAMVKDGKVINVIVADQKFIASVDPYKLGCDALIEVTDLDPQVEIGDLYVNFNFVKSNSVG